jgi:hypothetical protein
MGEDLGRRKQWRAAAIGGEGAASQEKKEEGVAAKNGEKGGGWPLGFLCGRKETTPQMTLTWHPTGQNHFPTSTHQRSTFGNVFWGYYRGIVPHPRPCDEKFSPMDPHERLRGIFLPHPRSPRG